MARRIFRDGFVLALCITFQAGASYGLTTETVADFEAWTSLVPYGDVRFTPKGDSLDVFARSSGEASLGFFRMRPPVSIFPKSDLPSASTNDTGIFATLNVQSAAGDAGVGLGVLVGIRDTKRIVAYAFLDQYQGKRSVRYLLEEEDQVTAATNQLSVGVLGSWYTGWTSGTDLLLAVLWHQGVVYFYLNGFNLIPTFIPLNVRSDTLPEVNIFSRTDGTESEMRATLTGLGLIRP